MKVPQFQSLSKNRYTIFIFLGMAMLILGSKLWMIDTAGNATPYSDQWNAEATQLYKPWLEGSFKWQDIFTPQNEHRILPTKLLSLWLLELNELWSPLLQMLVNASIHILSIIVLVALLCSAVGKRHLIIIAGTATILFCTGTGWANTLHGVSSLWYFNSLFGIPALWLLTQSKPMALKWWLGAILGFIAAMSAASGALLFAAYSLVWLIIVLQGGSRNIPQLAAGVISLLVFFCLLILIPQVDQHEHMRAKSIGEFVSGLIDVWAWPLPRGNLAGMLLHLPAAVFAVTMLITKPMTRDRRWFLFSLAAWSTAQGLSLAFGRASNPISSRYTDLLIVDLLTNLACLLSLKNHHLIRQFKWMIVGWMLLLMAGAAWYVSNVLPVEFVHKKLTGDNHQWYTHAYMRSGDGKILESAAPLLEIPTGDAHQLKELLDDTTIRRILPNQVRGQINPVKESEKMYSFATRPLYPNAMDWEGAAFTSKTSDKEERGLLEIEYIADQSHYRWIEVKVRAQVKGANLLLGIEQNGNVIPHQIEILRNELWNFLLVARVAPGPFKLIAIKEPNSKVIEFTAPSVRGSLDHVLAFFLASYPGVLVLGAWSLLWGLANSGQMRADQS